MTLREIDAAIAEKVMGYWKSADGGYWHTAKCGTQAAQNPYECDFAGHTLEVHRYTTDPGASKQLRAKLAEKFHVSATNDTDCRHWLVTLKPHGCAVKCYEAEAKEFEMALTLCALKSVGVEVEVECGT